MVDGLFQPAHLLVIGVLLVGVGVLPVGVFLVFRILWRLGSKLK